MGKGLRIVGRYRKRRGVCKGFSGSANSLVPVIRSKQVSTVQRNEHEGMIGGLVNASAKRKKKERERGNERGLIYLSTGSISP